ncbi:hypothetical protein PQO03_07300 [Lentisphaera profundi]|uniref:Uncharacterized protein n=1 Tax=Lentisphaera profundi TaxID=1658616 RepID=A0ABY7VN59_9BACT|nr:hypothetical protein [Lentisphaera profundi]WDE95523.1 hypothetical protein PQO03_07300 [Lentisphaera profundi]
MRRQEFVDDRNWHNRGYLPHYDVANKYQMITYRLADSVPQDILGSMSDGNRACIKNKKRNHRPGSAGVSPAKSKKSYGTY